jgi:catechol 2,3-dioxygenase-like lactoylglutathione lyase family enzyme
VTAARVNHVGLCVADIARSRRFYEALGFQFERDLQPPDDLTGPLLGISQPVGLTAVYLRCGDIVLELLHYRHSNTSQAVPRRMNELGLTHLSFTVADLPDVLGRVREAGGEVLDETDIGLAIMVRDPDGQLLELLPQRSPS